MKRVLIITYYWPPSGGSGVQRWVKFAKYLPSEGWQPVIYTPDNPELTTIDHSLASDIPPEAEILRRHITEPYGAYRRLLGRGGSTDGGVVTPISSGRKSLKQRLSLYIRGNFFIPDPRIWWVRPSVRYLTDYLREHPVDMIVTTGPPQSMHLVGLRLHEKTHVPWIADFRDPWTKMYYLKHLGLRRRSWEKHRRLEQEVLDRADAVIAVTKDVQESFMRRTGTPVAMITNGYDEDDFKGVAVHPDGSFNITHTGLFADDGNPLTLWQVLGAKAAADPEFASRLRIRLSGKTDAGVLSAIRSSGLGDNLVEAGYLSHDEAVREQLGASLLLLPLRNDPDYSPILPGKLFEYLSARRPILGIGQVDGAMAHVIGETASGQVFGWDDRQGMSTFVDSSWAAFREGRLGPTEGDISAYSRRILTGQLSILMEKIIQNHG